VPPINKLAEIEEDSSPVDITAASSEEDRPSAEVFHRKPIMELKALTTNNKWSLFDEESNSGSSSSSRSSISGDAALLPSPFHGLPTENPFEYTAYFKTYVRYKHLSNVDALELFKVLARGQCATWISTLDSDTRSDPTSFSNAFYARYMSYPSRQIRLGKDLFSRRQGATESVDDYFVDVQSHAQQMEVDVSDDILRHKIMAGLRPALVGTVMAVARHATSLDDLLEAARAAELMISSNAADAKSVSDLALEIKRLSDKIEATTVRRVSSRSPSPNPRRVSFDLPHDNQTSSGRPQSINRPNNNGANTYGRYESGYNGSFRRRSPVYYQNQAAPFQQQFQPQQSASAAVNVQHQATSQQQQDTSPIRCSRCNLLHGPNGRCAAMGRRCFGCGLMNHFMAQCRTTRTTQNLPPQ